MVEWRPLIISIIFAVSIYVVSLLASMNGSYLAVLFGGAILGYMINGTLKDGVIHGAILGLITGIIAIIVLLIQIASYGLLSAIAGALVQSIIILLVIEIVIAIIGGILGTFINSESLVSDEAK